MSDLDLTVGQDEKTALVIDGRDNVAVALTDLKAGDRCIVRMEENRAIMTVVEDIPFGHKFALTPINQDESVYKYGEEIGKMKTAVRQGEWIHSHNMYCERGMK
jgi:altronate dehydratase